MTQYLYQGICPIKSLLSWLLCVWYERKKHEEEGRREGEWDLTDLRGWENLCMLNRRGGRCQTDYHCNSLISLYQHRSCFTLQLNTSPSFILSSSSSPSSSRDCRDIKVISAGKDTALAMCQANISPVWKIKSSVLRWLWHDGFDWSVSFCTSVKILSRYRSVQTEWITENSAASAQRNFSISGNNLIFHHYTSLYKVH